MHPDESKLLLDLSNASYQFLLHLARLAKDSPDFLPPKTIAALQTKAGCLQWTQSHDAIIPSSIRPTKENRNAFAMLLWSYFKTSFHFDTMKWNGRPLDTNLIVGTKDRSFAYAKSVGTLKFYALKHLLSSKGISLSDKALKRFVRRASIAEDLTLWTYAWELRQRAKGKSKGPKVHALWRSMPFAMRKNITAERISLAQKRLCAAASKDLLEFYQRALAVDSV